MLDKLKGIEDRFADIERQLGDPAVIGNNREYAKVAKERAQLQSVIDCIREYRRVLDEIAGHKSILEGNDHELRELAKEELPALTKQQAALEAELKRLLAPRDPNDEKNVILEIRAGTGGEEASLFASELFRMAV